MTPCSTAGKIGSEFTYILAAARGLRALWTQSPNGRESVLKPKNRYGDLYRANTMTSTRRAGCQIIASFMPLTRVKPASPSVHSQVVHSSRSNQNQNGVIEGVMGGHRHIVIIAKLPMCGVTMFNLGLYVNVSPVSVFCRKLEHRLQPPAPHRQQLCSPHRQQLCSPHRQQLTPSSVAGLTPLQDQMEPAPVSSRPQLMEGPEGNNVLEPATTPMASPAPSYRRTEEVPDTKPTPATFRTPVASLCPHMEAGWEASTPIQPPLGTLKTFSRTINVTNRCFRESSALVIKPCKATHSARVLPLVRASVAAAPPAITDVPGIETTHDANVHGKSGAVEVEVPGLKRATELRNIIFVTSEVAPWSKTGGLADVLGSLPFALAERGHRVMVVAPRYEPYEGPVNTGVRVTLMGHAEVGYFHQQIRGVDFVFVDHPSYPRPGGLYADTHGVYGDNQFRFTLLCLAALEAPFFLELPLPPQQLDPPRSPSAAVAPLPNGNGDDNSNGTDAVPSSKYGQDVMFIANDWHASLVPVYLAAKYRPHGVYGNARCILAIHNLRHQGVFPPGTFASLDLPHQWYGCLEWQYPPHQRQGSWAEEGRSVNHLKAGLTTADRIVTVSAGYAEEIKTYLGGWGMEGILSARDPVLNGVVNGIDTDEWNPATDPHLPFKYDTTNFVEGKAKCKMELQTGGLRDTVIDFDPWSQSGTGWTYTSCDAQGLLHATGLALLTYQNHRDDFRKLQLRGMTREASWDQAAQQYEQIINWTFMDPPYCR
ncbi:hypothetical protein VOLCADRAFT_98674 [Volvox carteri f. nagariensis]|uniref:Starch synthase catalytic domain-containing protein n=1 Tax=Volvox carteri f. nagariensis TaxID=3068 RepID=D8UFZ7_VOLCA|nr:uncharacterized protein VOLCADRAFT_98674 [Volvox carteri f. nagariensis]EFJ41340.1 hypothetical protein VOLCADRAFT_98674 [Volvox carteri f. nagariensis]|eukprot:XP_002957570.1 hypothetical protein VOLCADRAFT_98674 [Volvox carteri f. nagariensis]